MDNDIKIIKILKKFIKNAKFRFDYRNLNILTEESGNQLILDQLVKNKPLMVARGGATEMRCIAEYLEKGTFSEKIKHEIKVLSGVFPVDDATLQKFCEHYIESMASADIISLWGVGAESKVVHKYCNDAKFTELHALEPYYFDQPWSAALKGKKILVVHPFTDSIKKQYARYDKIYPDKKILPKFESLVCLKAVQSIAGQQTDFESWFDALEYMKREIELCDFDVAIIGAGAYGLPLAAHCKKIGKKAIQMSGATQILFGIKGKRWDNHPVISRFYNESWIRPSIEETPAYNQKVEGGSYW